MTPDEIKTRLAGYRPELYPDDDPLVAEALRLARADPELSAWLDDEVAFDRDFSAQIASEIPPAGSRQALFDEVERELAGSDPGTAQQAPASRQLWTRRPVLAAAAIAILAAVVVRLVIPPKVEFDPVSEPTFSIFREHMAHFATHRFMLDEFESDLAVSRQWLADRGAPIYGSIPDTIAGSEGIGCKILDWNGLAVSLVCFRDRDGAIVHVFSIAASDLKDATSNAGALETVEIHRGLETAGWTADGNVYLLVGSKPEVAVSSFL